MTWILAVACGLASVPAAMRWIRVAQREHYLAPSVTRFARRWWTSSWLNVALVGIALVGVVGTLWSIWPGFLVALAQVGPIGLSPTGRTSPMTWTARSKRLAIVAGTILVALYLAGAAAGVPFLVVVGLLALPLIVDLALLLLRPIEVRLGSRWVDRAAQRLSAVGAQVVAITGSYGKTTTKGYVAHLLSHSRRVVASPASYNNRMGLARAINENLTAGIEVFVAEMGTYGPGEIASLCEWVPPSVAAIISVGPVHLERFKTEERILAAKAEILDRAHTGVICVDHPLLSRLAEERSRTMKVLKVSTGEAARVSVVAGRVWIDGSEVAEAPPVAFPANLAVAIGVCLALGVDPGEILSPLSDLPATEHRQTVSASDRGFSIIDNTFNSNPVGALIGLSNLAKIGEGGRKTVVTPGMVELGRLQTEENRVFAAEAARVADNLVIVGRTNRRALMDGAAGEGATITFADTREEAVAWVRENLGPGDAVLYENDLPDHYP